MEIIRNYLESMFASLPNTPEVLKAKDELWQMMEDKYNELISSGKNENEAVGTVISEFGNLNEIADDLGISENISMVSDNEEIQNRRHVTLDEAKSYLRNHALCGLFRSIGIFFCIISIASPVIGDALFGYNPSMEIWDKVFLSGMFVLIAVGVAFIVAASAAGGKWKFLKKEPCYIDYATSNYINDENERSAPVRIAMRVIGIALCILCFIPAAILDSIDAMPAGIDMGNIGGGLLIGIVAAGVFLIVLSNSLGSRYERLLNLNDVNTVSGSYQADSKKTVLKYDDDKLAAFMAVYKPTVLCIYLIWSFLTFDWYITWIIWPISVVIRKVIEVNLGSTERK